MSSGTRPSRVELEGQDIATQKEAVMKTLREEMNISQDDIDFLYARFGEKCLISVEKFFEYKEIDEKKMRRNETRKSDIGAQSLSFQKDHNEASRFQSGSESYDESKYRGGTDIKSHIETFGLKGIKDVLRRSLDEWKEKPLNIAVTGHSGNGKSSLINAMRKMNEWDKGAAKVDEKECTTECRSYPHPEYDNIVFWDVPGVGTEKFPKETYIEKVQMHRYDFFIITIFKRFTAIDVWLAKEIRKQNKHFYFVRTHTDVDMENIKRRPNKNYEEQKEFDKLKKGLREEITKDFESSHFHFFMISNRHPDKYDFPLLLQQLLEDVPNEKKARNGFRNLRHVEDTH